MIIFKQTLTLKSVQLSSDTATYNSALIGHSTHKPNLALINSNFLLKSVLFPPKKNILNKKVQWFE